jgi:hypothetical protein
MDGVVRPGVNRRSTPAVRVVAPSKIDALSEQRFLAMENGRVGNHPFTLIWAKPY